MTTALRKMKSEDKVEWKFGLQTSFDYDQIFNFLKRNFPTEGFLQESLGNSTYLFVSSRFLGATAPSLLSFSASFDWGWKVAHTKKPITWCATETAWNTPEEFDKRTEKKKKAIWNLPNFSTIPRSVWNFFPDPSGLRIAGLPGWQAAGRGLPSPLNWWIPRPHRPGASQSTGARKGTKGKRKSPRTLSLNKSPPKFVPIELLCKHVTNPLKPATNCLCPPINLCSSWGSRLFLSRHRCVGCGRSPGWVSNKGPFFVWVVSSWKPSLFPLGDSDIGQNKNNTTFFPSDWFSNGIWLLPASKMWSEVLMERFEEVFLHLRQSHKKS